MGFTPAQVDAMGLWEFAACAHGYARTHGGGEKGGSEDYMTVDRARILGLDGFDG